MKNKKNAKGSILAYSLIVITAMLAIAGSIASIASMQRKAAGASRTSAQSFQLADSAAQIAVKKINAVLKSENNRLINAFPSTSVEKCQVDGSGLATVSVAVDATTNYKLTFFKVDGTTAITTCDEPVTSVKQIKSSASFRDTIRVVMITVGSADSSTKLLLHADGPDNSTTFLDSSNYEKVVKAMGGAKITTAYHMFASGGSAYFDGTNDYLQLQDSSDWDFGTGDFAVEFWERSVVKNKRQHALSFGSSALSRNLDFDFNDNSLCDGSKRGIWVYWNGTGSNRVCGQTSDYLMNDAWHHIALERKAGIVTLYIDGNPVGSTTYTGNINLSGNKYAIGALSTGTSLFWSGYLDEIRISNTSRSSGGVFPQSTMPY